MMAKWRKVLGGADQVVLRGVAFGWRVLLWPAVYSVAWASAAWPFLHTNRMRDWSKNELDPIERFEQLEYVLIALVVMGLLLLTVFGIRRAIRGEWRIDDWARSFNRFFSFSLALPFLVGLQSRSIEVSDPLRTLLFIAVCTVSIMPTASILWEVAPRREASTSRWRARFRAATPGALVGSLVLGYSVWFSRLAVNNHHALQTRIFDLAIYDNIFYHSAHGNPLGCSLSSTGTHISGHFDPILVVLSPLYHLYPRAELILILQAVWCGLGAIPTYLLAKHHLGSKSAGLVFAVAWALYPALHGANLYEFHSLTLLAMPMMWLLYFLTTGRVIAFFVLLPLVLLVREDVSLLLCCVAFTAILTGDSRLARLGWITFALSSAYFVVTKLVIMAGVDPAPVATLEQIDPLGGKHGFAWYYTDLIPKGGSFRDLLSTLFANPLYVLDVLLNERKIIYLLQLFLPLVLLPLFGKPWRFMMAFGLFYLLLASKKPVYSIHFQYSVVLFPVLFALAPIGLARLRDGEVPRLLQVDRAQLVSVLLAAVLVSSGLMSWKFGGVAPNAAFRGGWQKPPRTLSETQRKRYDDLVVFMEQIPPDAALTAIGRVGPHLSNRAKIYKYRHRRPSAFLVFDRRDLKGTTREAFKRRLADGELEQVDKKGTFELYRVVK